MDMSEEGLMDGLSGSVMMLGWQSSGLDLSGYGGMMCLVLQGWGSYCWLWVDED